MGGKCVKLCTAQVSIMGGGANIHTVSLKYLYQTLQWGGGG